jgi:hypothetical protein
MAQASAGPASSASPQEVCLSANVSVGLRAGFQPLLGGCGSVSTDALEVPGLWTDV